MHLKCVAHVDILTYRIIISIDYISAMLLLTINCKIKIPIGIRYFKYEENRRKCDRKICVANPRAVYLLDRVLVADIEI